MTRTTLRPALLCALLITTLTGLCATAGAQTLTVSSPSWERSENAHTHTGWHGDLPVPYYGDDPRGWSFIGGDVDEVWPQSSGDYRWFYSDDWTACDDTGSTHHWFRTTVNTPNGSDIVQIRVFDAVYTDVIGVNDAAFLYINGQMVDTTGLSARTGTATLPQPRRMPMGWEDQPLVASEGVLSPQSNEVAILFEVACVSGGIGRLDIEITTDDTPPDTDGDGVADSEDACPGFDDALDEDSDSVPDGCDVCQGDDASGDADEDGVCSDGDNCPSEANTDQADGDSDGVGDLCEADTDEDGVIDDLDNCPIAFNPTQEDNDLDAAGDVCDSDDDNDGVDDEDDNCLLLPNTFQLDFDGDGQGDVCDGDDDADGFSDEDDLCMGTSLDAPVNGNGCSGPQFVEVECGQSSEYRRRGRFVRCVVRASRSAVRQGLLSRRERAAIVRNAARCR